MARTAKPSPGVPQLVDALHRRYPRANYAVFTQVRAVDNRQLATRIADALVMGLWRSRGFLLEGFEFKVQRSDWLHELKAPAKADEFFAYCDRWWLVTTSAAIAKPSELPAGWGLLVLRGLNLQVVVPAPQLSPQPLDRFLVASVLRAAVDNLLPEAELKKERALGEQEGRADADAVHARERATFEAQRAVITEFERSTGLHFALWDQEFGPRLGAAVRTIQDADTFVKRMQSIADQASHLAASARDAAATVSAAAQVVPESPTRTRP